jgi:hypothetical protein
MIKRLRKATEMIKSISPMLGTKNGKRIPYERNTHMICGTRVCMKKSVKRKLERKAIEKIIKSSP